jgi:hypothetical protein
LRHNSGNFLQPRISGTGVHPLCDQSGQHCIAGKVLQRSFAASVVQRELGSVMQVAASLPLSKTAVRLSQMRHEEPNATSG